MDPLDRIPRWAQITSPTRTLVMKLMSRERSEDHSPQIQSPVEEEEEEESSSSYQHNIANTIEEGDDVPINNFPSSAQFTPPPSPPHISCLSTPSRRLYDSGKRSRSIKMEERSRSIKKEELAERSRSAKMEGGAVLLGLAGTKEDEGRVYVTWKDLWVTVPGKKGGRRAILKGLTGYVQPGACLAIMGPSGCGKSTLLDALAGRLASNITQAGDILINGRKQALAFGTSAYVTQDDTLMTTLTVREAVYYSAQLQLPDSMSRAEKRQRAEETIREMGLQDAMNTRIGGWSVKGLSGGQKRRVSICIEILRRPTLLFLDEPTSGLDSAASYHVMSRIIRLAQHHNRTVIASIHQPSGEVYDLFHNLCLLSSGKQVYFGPTLAANEFFASNGFPCPTMRNPSDHFLRTINKDFEERSSLDVEKGDGGNFSATKAIDILVRSYESSEKHQQVINKVSEICQKNHGTIQERGGQASFVTQCLVLTRRSFVNMYRDLGYYWLRLGIYIALGLCMGTIYYDVGMTYGSILARASMLMFISGFLTFMAIGGFPSFVEDMKIFTRERLNGHYGVASYVVGNTFSSTPYLLINSLFPGLVAYYLVGLQKGFDHFVFFVLQLYSCLLVVESLMMIVASIVPDYLMGIITGAGIQGVMMLNGGFFRLRYDVPKPFWRYPVSYISFHKYSFQGFYKNEFLGLTFPNKLVGGPPMISGEQIVSKNWQIDTSYSKWVDLSVLLGMIIFYRILFFGIIKIKEKMKVKPMFAACKSCSCMQAEDMSSITRSSDELGCSVRRVRAFSLLECRCYMVDLTFPD